MENITPLLERFLESQKNNTAQYFDVVEIISLINYFMDEDDVPNLSIIVELGYRLHPDDFGLSICLCRALIEIEDFNFALKLIDHLGNARYKILTLMRLECYCGLDRYDEAIKLLGKLTAKNSPYLEEAIIQTVSIMNDRDNCQQRTYKLIKRALTMFPANPILEAELCFNLELQGKTKEALTLCRELINKDPYSAELWYMQGRIYSSCEDFERAIDSLDFALTCISDEQDPELEYEIKLMKAYCLYKNESYKKAISIYEELTSYDEFVDSDVDPFLAECYMSQEEYEQAYRILKRLAESEDLEDEVSVYGNLIYCCIETGRREEAIDILSDMLKHFPGSILEYLSALSPTKDQPADLSVEKNYTVDDLVRTYMNNNVHNN